MAFSTSPAKNSFVSLNTMGLSRISAIKFGTAMKAFSVSASSQTKPRFRLAPMGTAMHQRMRKGRIDLTPKRNSTHFSQ